MKWIDKESNGGMYVLKKPRNKLERVLQGIMNDREVESVGRAECCDVLS